jgi:hypothetical protein
LAGRPGQRPGNSIAGVHGAARVPGVQVGLSAVAQLAVPVREPAEELAGGGELLAGEPADGRGERFPPGPVPEPRELAPCPVLAKHALVRVAGEGGVVRTEREVPCCMTS